MGQLPNHGSVLGVDVGFSATQRSSAVCRLDWDDGHISWTTRRFRLDEDERRDAFRTVVNRPLLAAAFDGPLRPGLDLIQRYRRAEKMLTRRLQPLIGKPGQSSAPVGIKLNLHANLYAGIVADTGHVAAATHRHAIHSNTIVEAFPSTFLGVLLEDPAKVSTHRGNRSDNFYVHLSATGKLASIFLFFLADRQLREPLQSVTNHDDRAALVCALTALCVAADDYVAVGDGDGWIILPPRKLIQSWAWNLLEANAQDGPGLEWSPQ